jgi:hypothetical protein
MRSLLAGSELGRTESFAVMLFSVGELNVFLCAAGKI